MRSPRLIAIVYLKNELVVQSENFSTYYPIGSLNKTLEYLYKWGVDEIIILSIDGNYNYKILKESLKGIHLPVTFGGNIRTNKEIQKLLDIGVDKVSFNQLLKKSPEKIYNFSKLYGKQFIVGSVDVKKFNGKYYEYDYSKKKILDTNILQSIKNYQKYGVGEFLLNFVDNDGIGNNINTDISKKIASFLSVPLIVCGGAKNIDELVEFYKKTNANPAVGNLFHHFENSARLIKEQLLSKYNEIRDPEYKFYKKNNLEKVLGRNEN
jgi:imidazole glycerol-phosphate synthase subunit HisF